MKAIAKIIAIISIGLGIALFAGPRAKPISLDPIIFGSVDLSMVSQIERQELALPNLKKDNQARVIWADSIHQKTEYALVYLHGFSASSGEGDPLHEEFAKRYHSNAFLARLDGHGLKDENALLDMSPEGLLESAKQAIEIGKVLGDKVIVMSCSTGSTLALYLAAYNPELIDGLICYSPNIDIYDPRSHLLDGPWGLQLARAVNGGDFRTWDAESDEEDQFWTTSYRVEALIDLRLLIDETMTAATFARIKQPLLVLYYYKSEEEQDHTVSVRAMKEMFDEVGTIAAKKRMIPIPGAGHHVIASKYRSQDLDQVRRETFRFAEEVLELRR